MGLKLAMTLVLLLLVQNLRLARSLRLVLRLVWNLRLARSLRLVWNLRLARSLRLQHQLKKLLHEAASQDTQPAIYIASSTNCSESFVVKYHWGGTGHTCKILLKIWGTSCLILRRT